MKFFAFKSPDPSKSFEYFSDLSLNLPRYLMAKDKFGNWTIFDAVNGKHIVPDVEVTESIKKELQSFIENDEWVEVEMTFQVKSESK